MSGRTGMFALDRPDSNAIKKKELCRTILFLEQRNLESSKKTP